ncbi:uncharacterized protein EI90DRAFT_3062951 [Cantharellus anzutake]|uniref:uncharacterized protein n=1 Tax=Cantharellus anzutake TaxID=1750568 RepID=UPI00190808C1|nr:uncharacterized protein EI90DRAFT_3062951 [Cantharellus anzutake]KAF8329541.1 hypothetical protein EI90DRAFT_3062951 [Cantharellus anzutake]
MGIFKSLRSFLLRRYGKKRANHDVSNKVKRRASAPSASSQWSPLPHQRSGQLDRDLLNHCENMQKVNNVGIYRPTRSAESDSAKLSRRNTSPPGTMDSHYRIHPSPKAIPEHHNYKCETWGSRVETTMPPRIISSSAPYHPHEFSGPRTGEPSTTQHQENTPLENDASPSVDGVPLRHMIEKKEGTYTVTVHRRKRHALTNLKDANRELDSGIRSPPPNGSRSNTASSSSSRDPNGYLDTTSLQFSGASSFGSGFSGNELGDANLFTTLNDDSAIANILRLYDDDGLLPDELFSNTPQRRALSEERQRSYLSSDSNNANESTISPAPQDPGGPREWESSPTTPLSLSVASAQSLSSMHSRASVRTKRDSALLIPSASAHHTNRLRLSSPMLLDFLFSPESIYFTSQAGGSVSNHPWLLAASPPAREPSTILPETPERISSLHSSPERTLAQNSAVNQIFDQTGTDTETGYSAKAKDTAHRPYFGETHKVMRHRSMDPATGFEDSTRAPAVSLTFSSGTWAGRSRDSAFFSMYSTPTPSQLELLALPDGLSRQSEAASLTSQSISGHHGATSIESVVEDAIIDTVQWMAFPATATYTSSPSLTLSPDPCSFSNPHSPALIPESPNIPATPDAPSVHDDAGIFDVSKLRGSPIPSQKPAFLPRSASNFSRLNQLNNTPSGDSNQEGERFSSPTRRLLTSYPFISGSNKDLGLHSLKERSVRRKGFLYGWTSDENFRDGPYPRLVLDEHGYDDETEMKVDWSTRYTGQLDCNLLPSIHGNLSSGFGKEPTTHLGYTPAHSEDNTPDFFGGIGSDQLGLTGHSRESLQSTLPTSRIPRLRGATKAARALPKGKENDMPLAVGRVKWNRHLAVSESKMENPKAQDQAPEVEPSIMPRQVKAPNGSSTFRPLGPTDKMSFGWDLRKRTPNHTLRSSNK